MPIIDSLTSEITIVEQLFGKSYEDAGGAGHRYYHSVRVAHNCENLSLYEHIENPRLLVLAGLFHDIGKSQRIEQNGFLDGRQEADVTKGNHEDYALVRSLLEQHLANLHSAQDLDIIASYISNNDSKESKLLKDADNLDEVGLVNVWKMFTYGGLKKVSIKDTVDYYFEEDKLRLQEKVNTLMHFDISKQIANERMQKVDEFLRQLDKESKGEDISALKDSSFLV